MNMKYQEKIENIEEIEGGVIMRTWHKIKWDLKLFIIKLLDRWDLREKGIFYIGGSEALPPPLSNDEEEYLMVRLKNGDSAAKTVLIERNLRLVVYIARKFENTGVGVEDLISIGTIGLIKAVNTFDPFKNIKLATYASRCIENEILMYLRRNSKSKLEVSFDEPLNVDWDGNELLLSDVLGTDAEIVSRNVEEDVDRQLLNMAIKKLSDKEKKIIKLRFGINGETERTQKEVADMLGISQSYISRLEKRIIKRLRKEISKMA
ncbi:RNA polymerase, sigma 29 subunit, SigE [Caldanaerobius fijiensis DSM 17918]|uniref:RNA polymerase sigma factor n=2 Tax=Caldanaerobius TaxID=862261 RepID=A0A1M4T1G0_9THEO|nr:RNA polymerase, sigma 29 subunit, SigE [Caldanaerobius fijiensis DSM 17918]